MLSREGCENAEYFVDNDKVLNYGSLPTICVLLCRGLSHFVKAKSRCADTLFQ